MSFFNQGRPARIKSVYGHTTGTAYDTVYTCPANCVAEVTFIHVVNGGSSTNSVELEWYVAADNYTSHFLKGKSINASDYVTFTEIDLVLQENDEIRITPSSAGHIDTILTVTESFNPVG